MGGRTGRTTDSLWPNIFVGRGSVHAGAFREEHGIEFALLSDVSGRQSGLETDIAELGPHGIANRAVPVLDEDGTVTYGWEADDPTNELDYDELLDAVAVA